MAGIRDTLLGLFRICCLLLTAIAGFLIAFTLLRCRKQLFCRLFAFSLLVNVIGIVFLLRFDEYWYSAPEAVRFGLYRCIWSIELGAHVVLLLDRILWCTSADLYKKMEESEVAIKRLVVCCLYVPLLFVLPMFAKSLLHSKYYYEGGFTKLGNMAYAYMEYAHYVMIISLITLLVQVFRSETMAAQDKALLKRLICVYTIYVVNDRRYSIFGFLHDMCEWTNVSCGDALTFLRIDIQELFELVHIWGCVALIPEIRAAFMAAIHCRPSMEEYEEAENRTLVSV